MRTVAALYVAHGGTYYGLPDVEPWGLPERDAREYAGPHPVVAHPPCARWGRYWSGGPSAKTRRRLGDDDGCFLAAFRSTCAWGGVLEHPEGTHAWRAADIVAPPRAGGWISAGLLVRARWPAWTCCVEQGHYGHRARKATWLLYVGVAYPRPLKWGPSEARVQPDDGFHSAAERRAAGVSSKRTAYDLLGARERAATPAAFRDALLSLARTAVMEAA